MSKYLGIDERTIKCCDESINSRECGISFDELENGQHVLRFHFLEKLTMHQANVKPNTVINQMTRSMYLDEKNISELIAELKSIKKQIQQAKLEHKKK